MIHLCISKGFNSIYLIIYKVVHKIWQMPNTQLWKRQYKQQIIMEWYEAYVNFIALNKPLTELFQVYNRNHHQVYTHNHEKLVYSNLAQDSTDHQILHLAYNTSHRINYISLLKARAFAQYKKYQLSKQCLELQKIIDEMYVIDIMTHDHCLKRHNIKTVIKQIFTTAHYLRLFIELNEEIYENVVENVDRYGLAYLMQKDGEQLSVLIRRKDSYLEVIGEPQENMRENMNLLQNYKQEQDPRRNNRKMEMMEEPATPKLFLSSMINSNRASLEEDQSRYQSQLSNIKVSNIDKLQDYCLEDQVKYLAHIQDKMKILYSKLVFFDQRKAHRLDDLASLRLKETTKKTHLFVGLYVGMSLVAFLVIFILLLFGLVKINDQRSSIDSLKFIFPLFRGIGLFILYVWGMAWNSYGFYKSRVSYRRILQYGSHYSTYITIIKRASFFTLLFFIMLLLYFIGATANTSRPSDQRIPIQYTPFIVWVVFFGYIFFPNREVFNSQGRKYFYRVIKEVIKSPCGRMSFLISWITDQTVSFVIPIKDMGYTICFYTSDFSGGSPKQVDEVCTYKNATVSFVIVYLIALIPLLFRMAQCYRQAKQDSGKFIGHLQMWNFGKYLSSVMTTTCSFIYLFHPEFFFFFIVSSIISTIYAYCWDLKYDWGFLEQSAKHKFLRNHLSYNSPKYYYLAIVINLIMRMGWTLSISLVNHLQSPVITFLIGLIEIMRRCMWNFFRIEKEHITNCKNYSVTPDIQKQIDNLKKEGKVNITGFNKTNQDYQSIPYFINSKETQIHEVDIIPPSFIEEVNSVDINELKNNYNELIGKEKLEILDFQKKIDEIYEKDESTEQENERGE